MNAPTKGCTRCGDTGWVSLSAEGPGGVVRVTEASCPECCCPSAEAVLDWRAANHWTAQPQPCRYCTAPTHLRDADDRPAHKVCAETAAAPTESATAAGGAR
jgi:hypothetical protein